MKLFVPGVALAVIGAGLAAVPVTPGAAAAPDRRPLVERMRDDARGGVSVSEERATGKVGFVRATGAGADLLPGRQGTARQDAVAKASAYVDEYAAAFGAPASQLRRDSVDRGRTGTVVTYVQQYRGVPVFGSMLRAHLDRQGDLTAVNGELVPVDDLDVDPGLAGPQAGQAAVRLVRAQPPTDDAGRADTTGVKALATDLVVYRTGLTAGRPGGEARLAWAVEVGNEANVRDMVFLDADHGKVLNRYSMVGSALDRELYEADSERNLTLVWEEGDPLPGDLNSQQQNLVASTGESYWLYANMFGRDSYDGSGATMRTVNNDPAIRCPNATWNGETTNYCDGVTADDVVAHEWTHAYTEYTHGLIYQWQPGALNEAYSDIVGESLDLVNGRDDEGEGAIDEPRPVGQCSTHSPAQPVVTINAPSSIAKDCLTAGATFGEQLDGTGVTADLATPTDPVEAGGTATDGCSPYDAGQDVTGRVVLVDRGLCAFTQKAEVATDAGAAALIIGNRDDAPIGMSGDAPRVVPTVSVGLSDRELMRSAVADGQTVNVTLKDAAGDRVDSYRWLIGEKATAFGGAIRDMWSPTCYGDPGKVSDAEYKCSTDDQGGVHSNSGVPNHGYALLVDGGTFNGVTVGGIGMDKALNLYYEAMTEYQTPASDFVDHAMSLEASCADLTGKALNEVSVEPDDQSRAIDKITSDDCAQVAAMTRAVELRKDPTDQCEFQPLLAPGAPSGCGEGFTDREVFGEDFEITADDPTGFGGWTLSGENPYGGPTYPWEATRDYRGDHESRVAFAPDPDRGDCSGAAAGDITSVNYLTSGDITLPAEGQAQRMSFRHYIATEVGYDGGNVQVSVNGGDFAPVPRSAYVFNAPQQIATEAEGNTNPLAGQPGFTGTDGGSVFGSWGTSVVDLGDAGALPGDTLRIRFAMGRDGCGGVDGWYVDDVSVAVCEAAPPAATSIKRGQTYPRRINRGERWALKVSVVSEEAGTPDGVVRMRFRGSRIGQARLNSDGSAIVGSSKTFSRTGFKKLRLVYSGSDAYERSARTVAINVRR